MLLFLSIYLLQVLCSDAGTKNVVAHSLVKDGSKYMINFDSTLLCMKFMGLITITNWQSHRLWLHSCN